jgi:hypothetical protein
MQQQLGQNACLRGPKFQLSSAGTAALQVQCGTHRSCQPIHKQHAEVQSTACFRLLVFMNLLVIDVLAFKISIQEVVLLLLCHKQCFTYHTLHDIYRRCPTGCENETVSCWLACCAAPCTPGSCRCAAYLAHTKSVSARPVVRQGARPPAPTGWLKAAPT